MRLWKREQVVVGLDLGQATAKAVALRQREHGAPELVGALCLDFRAEGILGPEELRGHLPKWLKGAGWAGWEAVAALPSHAAMIRILDFPPVKDAGILERMIEHETQQVAGLSEELFVHGHVWQPPRRNHPNPVLLASCRQAQLEEQGEALAAAGLQFQGFGVAGLALANAWLALNPAAAEAAPPQLLLDMGTAGTTLVVLSRGQVTHLSVLPVGTSRYVQALARHGQLEEEAAAARLRGGALTPAELAALAQVHRLVEAELRGELDQWRLQEKPAFDEKEPGFIGLCGGGAGLPGLADALGRAFACPAQPIGVKTGDGPADPAFLVAYGLALQGLGAARIPVALATERQRRLFRRHRNFKFALAATLLFSFSLILLFAGLFRRTQTEWAALEARRQELQRCADLIPELQRSTERLDSRERMIIPLAAKANRYWRFLDAIAAVAAAKGEGDWLFYLGDSDSYRAGAAAADGAQPEAAAKPAAPGGLRGAGFPLAGLPLLGTAAGGEGGEGGGGGGEAEFGERLAAEAVAPLRTLVLFGYTVQPERSIRPVKAIQNKLNAAGLFAGVDSLAQAVDRPALFQPWQEFLARRPDLRFNAFPFALRLPFATTDIRPPADEPRKEGKP